MKRTPSCGARLLIFLFLAWAAPGAALAVAPANDNFSDISTIAGSSGTTLGSNVSATAEPGEPDHYDGNPVSASVWWHYTAPSDGLLMVDTVGSELEPGKHLDTVLAIYTGVSVDALTPLASNDDIDEISSNFQSRVVLNVISGTTYHIAVDGYNSGEGGETGTITLNWLLTANNDMLAGALPVTTPGTKGFNLVATKETDEPNHGDNPGGKSVWWEFAATTDQILNIDTLGSDFDTTLGVYEGTNFGPGFKTITGNEDYVYEVITQSRASLIVQAGHTYKIAVDGYKENGFPVESGAITLNLSLSDPTGNDRFADSSLINNAATSGTEVGNNTGASREADEPRHANRLGGRSLWWHWQAPANGTLMVNTVGSALEDTVLAAYTGSSIDALIEVASNDDIDFGGNIVQSQVQFPVTAGTTYRIAVDGYDGESGAVNLNWWFATSTHDDLVVDFGAPGIWKFMNDTAWDPAPLHTLSAAHIVKADLDNNGQDEVIVDFNPFGIWVWRNNTAWDPAPLHTFPATHIVAADLDSDERDELIVDFGPGFGIWIYRNNTAWDAAPLHTLSAIHIVAADMDNGEDELIVDFGGGLGIWVYRNGTDWDPTPLHTAPATHIAVADMDNNGQDEVIVDFNPFGIWIYRNDTAWDAAPLHTAPATHIVAADMNNNGKKEVIVDFNPFGIWIYRDDTDWDPAPLHTFPATHIVAADLDLESEDEIIVDFGPGFGSWIYRNDLAWDPAPLHTLPATHIVAGDLDGL